ncbi:MAG: response regulator [Candidatus Riflebacteria bacterium]|nr:response regulator [Candidatus Riflebacteria bacterium]
MPEPFNLRPKESSGPARKHRILVVDDETEVLSILSGLLALADYDVSQAADGPTALRLVSASPPDLVLLDLIMPGMNGEDVLRRIKANPATKSLPVIILTALDDVNAMGRCIKSGALNYLVKPVDTEVLLQVLDKTLTGHFDSNRMELLRQRMEERARDPRSAAPDLGQELRDLDSLRQELKVAVNMVGPVLKGFSARLSGTLARSPNNTQLRGVQARLSDMELLLSELASWSDGRPL